MPLKGSTYLLLALVIGLIGVFAIHRAISVRHQAGTDPVVTVVIADAEISSGTALDPKMLKVVNWPKSLSPPQAATSVQQVANRVNLMPLSKGEPVLLSKLAPEGTSAGLGGLLPPGKNAYTVKVDDVIGVAGFVQPGDYVDVVMLLPSPGGNEALSKVILQGIKVLSAGQIYEQKSGQNKPTLVNTVTLEVNSQQAEHLNLASIQGKIRLALRSSADKTFNPSPGVLHSSYFSGDKKTEKETPQRKAKNGRSVEVIKGMDRGEAKF
jgi:pilus assembly protein CpaB